MPEVAPLARVPFNIAVQSSKQCCPLHQKGSFELVEQIWLVRLNVKDRWFAQSCSVFCLPFPKAFNGSFARRMCEIKPMDLLNISIWCAWLKDIHILKICKAESIESLLYKPFWPRSYRGQQSRVIRGEETVWQMRAALSTHETPDISLPAASWEDHTPGGWLDTLCRVRFCQVNGIGGHKSATGSLEK